MGEIIAMLYQWCALTDVDAQVQRAALVVALGPLRRRFMAGEGEARDFLRGLYNFAFGHGLPLKAAVSCLMTVYTKLFTPSVIESAFIVIEVDGVFTFTHSRISFFRDS
ncbi:MAG: hypothetical protein Q8K06_06630 [Sulfuriferula sp.]|nr:hypothetical protein [Sulfuriferula sp.]